MLCSIARDAWMVRIRFSRRSMGTCELCVERHCPTNSAISATRLNMAWVRGEGRE